MIDVSYLYCGQESPSQPHRYGKANKDLNVAEHQKHNIARSAESRRPVVVWNITRTCNLKCIHCYSDSEAKKYTGELTTEDGYALIEDLAQFKIPALLFSGGEPLVRPDILKLIAKARQLGIHIVLSTNGTLLDEKTANQLASYKISYVGISLDGLGKTNDYFRGIEGAFERALKGFRACVKAGVKVGLRLTLTKHTAKDLNAIFDLIEKEGVNRACFYHLVPSGRGKDIVSLTPQESRRAVDTILQRTRDFYRRGLHKEILTVDNHCDGPYMYLKLLDEGDTRAEEVYNLLKWNGGGLYSSGVGIGCIDNVGNVHPDQFWSHYTLGNIRQRPFSQIWQDISEPLLGKLKNRKPYLKGRCAECRFVDLCGGSFRVRADVATGDPFAPDPACYLTDEEINLKNITQIKRNYANISNVSKLGEICACHRAQGLKKSLKRSGN